MQNATARYARIEDGLYVGNKRAVKDMSFLSNADISALINLTGKRDARIEDVVVFAAMLPSQELMDTEIPKTNAKLETIAAKIHEFRRAGRTVLIYCVDGVDKCMLAAGYYLIAQGQPYMNIIPRLEMLYYDATQRSTELAERAIVTTDPAALEKADAQLSASDAAAWQALCLERAARREIRCLKMASFRKILRLKGGAKK
jgi:hypothetical protein